MRFFHAALPLVFCTGGAFAEPASQTGAADLTVLLQTYLGATAGVVTVVPEGETYEVTLDFALLIAALPGAEASISPLVLHLTDNGDDTWQVTQDQAFDLALKLPGQLNLAIKMGNWAGSGIFDESLMAFSASSSQISDISVTEVMTDPLLGETKVAYSVASAQYDSTSTAVASGVVDSAARYILNGLTEGFSMPGIGEGAPPIDIAIAAETYAADAKVTGLRPDALYKLVAFLVANPSEAAMIAQQDAMKTILRDGMPLFDHMISSGTISAISVMSPLGAFGLDEAAVTVEANGFVADGLLREAFTLSGLTTPPGLVPDWATTLVPSQLSLDFTLSRFNLAAPIALMLDTLDFAKGPADPAAFEGQVMMALMPEGVVDFTLAPGGVQAPIYSLTYEAALSGGAAAMPSGTAKMSLRGMAEVQSTLATAPAEIGAQVAPMLSMAENMAQPGADGALLWALEMTADGGLLVNGVDIMGAGVQ